MSATNDALRLPPTFNRLAWSNLAAQQLAHPVDRPAATDEMPPAKPQGSK